jgi:carboxylate-amine ligase
MPEGESRVHRELLRNTVELVTGICESVPQAVGDLRESRDVVQRVARQRGLEIFSAGTHPFARWYDQEVSEGEPATTSPGPRAGSPASRTR